MEVLLPILFASLVGIGHAFEADHLIAVSNIVSRRDNTLLAVKDGFFWGLGHTTTIVFVGSIIIISRSTFLNSHYFEAIVGIMLVIMGVMRLSKRNSSKNINTTRYPHKVAYSVGLFHGLAGSGTLVLLVMSEFKDPVLSIIYLLIFGIGSMIGMFIAAGLLSIPFSQRISIGKNIRYFITLASSFLCILYGSWMFYSNI